MKILAVAFAYNEINHIADMVQDYRNQGCELNIIDNYSTDGTYEWLVANRVRTRQKDTGGTFNLVKLQGSLVNDIKEIKPDWVVYTGIDVVYAFNKPIGETIRLADKYGYNMVSIQHMNMYNTGETYRLPLRENYFYGRLMNRLFMIAKYSEPFKFEADSIQIENRRVYPAEGILINYGNCKPAHEREATYIRRKRAWDAGLDRNYGVHYLEGRKRGWLWEKSELVDIRETEYYKYIQRRR